MNFSHKKNNNALNIVKKRKIKILLNEPRNNECFECSNIYPEYISLNNGIFLCKECASNHSVLPKNISNIIKNNLNELTLKNIQYLSLGGNRKLTEFINMEFPNLKNFSPVYFYQTNAMDYYRRCLQYLIEGGARPVKPDRNKAYELVPQKYNQPCTKIPSNNNNCDGNYIKLSKSLNGNASHIKCNSYIKLNGNTMYPKIKPIVGTKNECRFTRSLSRHLDKNELTNNTSNYKNLNNTSNDDILNYGKITSPSSDFKGSYYSQLKNNYDTDGNYFDVKDFFINDINEQFNNISGIKEEIQEINLTNFNSRKDNSKLKKKINKRNKEESSIRVFKISQTMTNNNSSSNTNSKERSIHQKYLDNFNEEIKINISNRNDNLSNLNKYKSCANFNNERKKFINNIEDLRIYLNSNKNHRNQNDIDRKAIKQKKNVNNINNNIIINRNLNVFYNNRNNDCFLQKVFKKKTIGDSFSIIEKKNNENFSSEKSNFFMTSNDEKNIFKLKKKHKIDIKKKLKDKIFEKNNENTFIKVNKLNNAKKNKSCLNDISNTSLLSINFFGTHKIYNTNSQHNKENLQYNSNIPNNFNYNLNSNYNINNAINNSEYIINQKSELIDRISRVLKAQKEKKEKKKSFEKIKVNQKYKIKNIKRNLNNNNKINIQREKIIIQKENEKERYRNRSYTEIKIEEAKNKTEHCGRNIIPVKDLINIPFGKKRRILEIFKKHNFMNKSVSPDIKRLFRISSEPKISIKKEFNNTYSLTTTKFMKKKN